jgi:Photosynthesis affected mutant 68
MSSKSKKGSENSRSTPPPAETSAGDRLPFEPAPARKKAPKQPPTTPAPKAGKTTQPNSKPKSPSQEKSISKAKPAKADARQEAGIPEVVSRRMARRMAYFCGIPTSLGVLTFVVSYIVVTQDWLKLPTVAVVLVSMGGFGLGVLGLSYGVISASWDEERIGSLLGWEEFTTNLGRLAQAWREAREAKQKPNP